MVKMSHSSSRKKLVPSKVKVKARGPTSRELHLRDPTSGEDEHDLRVRTKGSSGRSKHGEGKDLKAAAAAAEPMDWLDYGQPLGGKKEATNNNIYSNGKHEFREQSSLLSLSDRAVSHSETIHDETSSNGNKDDDDDDDDESEDRMDTQQYDPERLKAFNLFVRMFVDENLDRMVPISKQPKEKIQAIIDSCTRQFPEFAERARKRIRTYLKSCRRNKRSRDGGWESSRPTPAHLTSVQAEQILAQACENESYNATLMRKGLEPVSQPLPILSESRSSKENGHHTSSSSDSSEKQREISKGPSHTTTSSNSSIAATIAAVASNTTTVNSLSPSSSSITATVSNDQKINLSLNGATASNGESLVNQLASSVLGKGLERSPLVDYSRTLNGNGATSMYRPNFNQTFQRPSPFPSLFPTVAVASATAAVVGALGNSTFPSNVSPLPLANGDIGPTDLSMKSKPLLAQKLSTTDVTTVRQLITGYRESAAFLQRSADELEQLLIQQHQIT